MCCCSLQSSDWAGTSSIARRDEAPQHKLTTLLPSTVSHVLIEPRGGEPIELAKRGEAWYLVRPFEARADRSQVERLLELTSAASKEKLAATELARFDLDRPALTVTLGEQRFAFGTVNPLNQEQYVQAGDGVYLLSSFYASLVPQKAERLLTHALFVEGETPVAFVLPGFRIELQGPKWVRVPAAPQEQPSQDDFNRWVEGWRFASSLLTQRAGSSAANEHDRGAPCATAARSSWVCCRSSPSSSWCAPTKSSSSTFPVRWPSA